MPWNNSDMCEVQQPRHNKDKCTSTEIRCCHCGLNIQVFPRNCPIFNREAEIFLIQTKERKRRLQALWKLLGLNPNPDLIFPSAVKNTSNSNGSKSEQTPLGVGGLLSKMWYTLVVHCKGLQQLGGGYNGES